MLKYTFSAFIHIAIAREITDDEYQTPSKEAIRPSYMYTLDRYEFKNEKELGKFLPIDDDTWGDFLIKQKGYVQKINLLNSLKTIDEHDEFYLINAWASYEDSQSPNFTEPSIECNKAFGYDPWSASHPFNTVASYQYNFSSQCDNCYVIIFTLSVPNCQKFNDTQFTLMNEYYANQEGLFNVTLAVNDQPPGVSWQNTKESKCGETPATIMWMEQWVNEDAFRKSDQETGSTLFGQLLEETSSQIQEKFPSDGGFNIINTRTPR